MEEYVVQEAEIVTPSATVDIVVEQPVVTATEQVATVAEIPLPQCDSCGARTELFDVPHHQAGNPIVWHYCKRCKMAHDVEVATTERLHDVMSVNPVAANDPMFVQDMRNQITQELLS